MLGQKRETFEGSQDYGLDIVKVIGEYIELTESGEGFKACCPFHNEKTPSFVVNSELSIFKCFGCGEGGNVIRFVSLYEAITYEEAKVLLGLTIPKEEASSSNVYQTNGEVMRFWVETLHSGDFPNAIDYLRERGIKRETARTFNLGYAPAARDDLRKNGFKHSYLFDANLVIQGKTGSYEFFRDRIMFPVISGRKVLGFSGRALDPAVLPKYINSKESEWFHKSDIIYGWNLAKKHVVESRELIIVEGHFDVIQLYQREVFNVVAASGSLNPSMVGLFIKQVDRVKIFADGDKPGIAGAYKLGSALIEAGLDLRIIYWEGQDPDSATLKMPFEEVVQKFESDFWEFCLLTHDDEYKIIQNMLRVVARMTDKLRKGLALKRITELTGYNEQEVAKWADNIRVNPFNQKVPKSLRPSKGRTISLWDDLVLTTYVRNEPLVLEDFMKQKVSPNILKVLEDPASIKHSDMLRIPEIVNRLFHIKSMKNINKFQFDLYYKIKKNLLNKEIQKLRSIKQPSDEDIEELQALINQYGK